MPDYRPLTEPLDRAAVDAFRARSRADHEPWSRPPLRASRRGSRNSPIEALIPIVVVGIGIIALWTVSGGAFFTGIVEIALQAPFPWNLIAPVFLLLVAASAVAAIVRATAVIRGLFVPRSDYEIAYRLTRFAAANGLRYGHEESEALPGLIFGIGNDRILSRRLVSVDGRRVQIGDYRYTEPQDSDSNSAPVERHWGYVSIELDRALPHMVLDSTANDRSVFGVRRSNLPASFARDQVLHLEGDFDKHFTLYAPSQYERDALYVFTPDLMALLIDNVGAFDVEIVDSTFFLYSGAFDLLDPRVHEWLRSVVATVGAKTLRQTARYADDRVVPDAVPAAPMQPLSGTHAPNAVPLNTIGAGGQRLRRRGIGWVSVVVFIAFAVLAFWDDLAPILHLPPLPF